MTIKQRHFVKKYIGNGGNGTQAAIDVYNAKNYNTAHAIAAENLQKPTIQKKIREALEAAELTPESISEYLKKAIVSGLGQKATNADALRGLDLYAKLTGGYQSVAIEQSYKVKLQKMSTKELRLELEKTQRYTANLLEDLK